MSTNLSRFFEKARLARGLKPGQLARIAGCQNVLKNGNRIRTFEITGEISRELLDRLTVVLEIDAATVEKLVEQDRRKFFENWLVWAIQPYLVVRLMAAIYNRLAVPCEITTMTEAEAWAARFARENKRKCCLVWSRKISCWFSEDGTLYSRTEAALSEQNVPRMKVGGKQFLFGEDLTIGSIE